MTQYGKNIILTVFCAFLTVINTLNINADNSTEEQAWLLINEAESVLDSDTQKAKEAAQKALQFSLTLKNDELAGLSEKLLGQCCYRQKIYHESITYFNSSIEHLSLCDRKLDMGISMYDLGAAYRMIDDYQNAEKILLKSISIFEEINEQEMLAFAYNKMASIYRRMSKYNTALEYGNKSLVASQKTGNLSLTAKCENELGLINYNLNRRGKAMEYFHSALENLLIVNDSAEIPELYINIGNVYRRNEDNYTALQNYEKASFFLKASQDSQTMFYLHHNIGKANFNLNKLDEAEKYFLTAIEIGEKQKSKSKIAVAKMWMARVYIESGQIEKARAFLNDALAVAEEIGSEYIEKDTYFSYYMLYNKTGEYQEALDNYQLYKELTNKMHNVDGEDSVSDLSIIYEVEKQENEITELRNEILQQRLDNVELKNSRKFWILISLLFVVAGTATMIFIIRRKNRQLQTTIGELEETVRTKDKLFTIIGHDLRSPFNSILGLSELMSSNLENFDEANLKRFSREIYMSANNAYSLLNNLLEWSRLQLGQMKVRKEEVNINKLVDSEINLCLDIASAKNIKLISEIDPDFTVFADASMLSIAVRNILSNAIKFSNKEETVNVRSSITGGNANITISDGGVGIPAEKINELFSFHTNTSTEGTNGEKGTGLGLVLSYELVKLNSGELKVSSRPGKTEFTISLPGNSK